MLQVIFVQNESALDETDFVVRGVAPECTLSQTWAAVQHAQWNVLDVKRSIWIHIRLRGPLQLGMKNWKEWEPIRQLRKALLRA